MTECDRRLWSGVPPERDGGARDGGAVAARWGCDGGAMAARWGAVGGSSAMMTCWWNAWVRSRGGGGGRRCLVSPPVLFQD